MEQITNYSGHRFFDVKIYENQVISHMKNIPIGDDKILLYNISSKNPIIITESEDARTPDVFGNKIVYRDLVNSDEVIKIYDINTQETKDLDNISGLQQKNPRISNNNVAFYGSYDGIQWDVFVKNLTTGNLKQLTDDLDKPVQNSIDINSELIIWDEMDGDLHIYNLQDSSIHTLANGAWPTIFGDRFAYSNEIETINDDIDVWLGTKNGEDITSTANNTAPTLTDILDETIAYNATWSKEIVANDVDGDTLTVSVIGDAFEMVGDKVQLKDSYRTQPGTWEGRISIDDNNGSVVEDYFNITVSQDGVIVDDGTSDPVDGNDETPGFGYGSIVLAGAFAFIVTSFFRRKQKN